MSDVRGLLAQRGLRPKKSFGQNFLTDGNVLEAIAAACVPDSAVGNATVVEFGAGTGALTAALAKRARQVVAVERDRDLVPLLESQFAHSVRVIEGDAQTEPLAPLFEGATGLRVLAGNLPYQITGRLLQRAVEHARLFDRAVFMVQLEVADRLLAIADGEAYGALSIFVQAAFATRLVTKVSPHCFYPPPDVHSAVVLLDTLSPPRAEETPLFRQLVRGAFETRRKTLRNAWKRVAEATVLEAAAADAGVSLQARGETLSVEQFAAMAGALGERLRKT